MEAQAGRDVMHVEKACQSVTAVESAPNLIRDPLAVPIMLGVTEEDLDLLQICLQRNFILGRVL
ncbi:hypothetical protein D3C71_2225940 [compost metagenome]